MYRYKIKSLNDNNNDNDNNNNNDNDNDNDNDNYNDSIKVLYDIFHSSTVPIVITEKEYPYRIIYINEAWKDLSGYSLKELYHQSIYYIRAGKINNIIINKKKSGHLFEHIFEIADIPSLNFKIGITKNTKNINLNQYHLLNKYIYNDLEKI